MKELDMTTIDYYNQNVQTYIERTKNFDISHLLYPFVALLKPGSKILDAGCGSGRDSLFFQKMGFQVLAIDGAEEMVKHASSLGIPAQKKLFEEISFENEFDAIWCCASLVHVKKENLSNVIARLERSLKPNGFLFVSFKMGQREGFENGRYFHYLDEALLRHYFANFTLLSLSVNPSSLNQNPTTWLTAFFRANKPTSKS